jgi:hypothetical protein
VAIDEVLGSAWPTEAERTCAVLTLRLARAEDVTAQLVGEREALVTTVALLRERVRDLEMAEERRLARALTRPAPSGAALCWGVLWAWLWAVQDWWDAVPVVDDECVGAV